MLATKRSAVVTPEVNLRNMQVRKHTSEGIQPRFETQGRYHLKSKTGISVAPQKYFCKNSLGDLSLDNLLTCKEYGTSVGKISVITE